MSNRPACVVVFSGKRKSGKDYVTERLRDHIGEDKISILRLSAPLKRQYAMENNLDFDRLLDASAYKEKYREDMILWGEEKRNKDPGYFSRLICCGPGSDLPVWFISDARRKTDVAFFKENYADCLITVRVAASEDTRKLRGWVFKSGVDDAESECGLDNVPHDFLICNDGIEDDLNKDLNLLSDTIQNHLS